jgi:hypothetical protein
MKYHFSLMAIVLITLTGCGQQLAPTTTTATTTSTSTTLAPTVILNILTFEADSNIFSVVVANNGLKTSGNIIIAFFLDRGFVEVAEQKLIDIGVLSPGEVMTLETGNTLTSTWGRGKYQADVWVLEASASAYATAEYYSGSYEAQYLELLPQYPTWVRAIKTTLHDEHGFPTTGDYPLRFADALAYDSAGITDAFTFEGVRRSVPAFSLGKYQTGYPDSAYQIGGIAYNYVMPESVIKHEYIHAYHREYVETFSGIANWQALESWFREAVATYFDGDGSKEVTGIVYAWKRSGKNWYEIVPIIADGLGHGEPHTAYDYPEDYLAFCYIIEHYGAATLETIIRDVAYGSTADNAVINNLGLANFVSFETAVYNYCSDYIHTVYDIVD